MKKIVLLGLLVTIFSFAFPTEIFAEVDIGNQFKLVPGVPGTEDEGTSVNSTFPTFGALIGVILPNLFIAGGVLLLIAIVYGGFTMTTSEGNPERTQLGQRIITNAIIGLVVVVTSYWLIQIIEFITGIEILNSTLI